MFALFVSIVQSSSLWLQFLVIPSSMLMFGDIQFRHLCFSFRRSITNKSNGIHSSSPSILPGPHIFKGSLLCWYSQVSKFLEHMALNFFPELSLLKLSRPRLINDLSHNKVCLWSHPSITSILHGDGDQTNNKKTDIE